MLKAIHAQESKKAAREKAKAVVEELRSMKLKEAAKKVEYYQRKKMNYKIALLAYLFDCVVVFFDLFSGKDHPLLCWIVPPPKDLS